MLVQVIVACIGWGNGLVNMHKAITQISVDCRNPAGAEAGICREKPGGRLNKKDGLTTEVWRFPC